MSLLPTFSIKLTASHKSTSELFIFFKHFWNYFPDAKPDFGLKDKIELSQWSIQKVYIKISVGQNFLNSLAWLWSPTVLFVEDWEGGDVWEGYIYVGCTGRITSIWKSKTLSYSMIFHMRYPPPFLPRTLVYPGLWSALLDKKTLWKCV